MINIFNMKIQTISRRNSEKLIRQSDDPRIEVDQIMCMDHFLCGSVFKSILSHVDFVHALSFALTAIADLMTLNDSPAICTTMALIH
jgi:hypothetical protein